MIDFISMLGYSDKSPYKHNPYLDIHTPDGTISMADTSIDLIGIDNKGNKKKMKAGRKNPYKFEGDIVREIPMAQKGIISGKKDEDGFTFKPYWENEEDRNVYRNRLKEISTKALLPGEDSEFLRKLPYAPDGPYCINGVCGLNLASGLKYNAPPDVDRYAGNTKFTDAVNEGKEDYYQVNGNFQIGDQLEYLDSKGKAGHAKIIYNVSKNAEGSPVYHVIHNQGLKEFVENIYTKQEMDDMVSGKSVPNTTVYKRVNVYRPGKSLDINKLKKERNSPEVLKAIEDRQQNLAFQKFYDPGYTYSLRPTSEYVEDTPAGITNFMEFANDEGKINQLLEKLDRVGFSGRADKNQIHDSLLNVFGILGQENKFRKAPITGVSARTAGENIFERIFHPKRASVGPGQIKFSELEPELKKEFGIKRVGDLYKWDKVIPLMVALDIRNKKWMEAQGDKFSERIVGQPGLSSTEMKWTEGRLSPYFYRGHGTANLRKFLEQEAEAKISGYRFSEAYKRQYIEKYIADNLREHQKVLDEGSYADDVYDYTNENIQRTAGNLMAEKPLQGITVTARKNKKLQGGGLQALIRRWSPGKGGNPYQEGGMTPEQVFNFLFEGDDQEEQRMQQEEAAANLAAREAEIKKKEKTYNEQLIDLARQRRQVEDDADYNEAMAIAYGMFGDEELPTIGTSNNSGKAIPTMNRPLGPSAGKGVNLSVLRTEKDIFSEFEGITNLGIWGDKSHQQRVSDHNTGDAQDFGIGTDIDKGNKIAQKLIAEAGDRKVKYIIFNGKIWNPSISNEWRPYRGKNPHSTHVHVSYHR